MLRRLVVLLLSLSACIAHPAIAGDPLRLALLHTEPWGFYAPDSSAKDGSNLISTGIMVEVAQAVAQESGIEFRHKLIPNARMWRDIKTGDCDLAFAIRSADRDDYVRYAGHLFTFGSIVVGRPGTKLSSYEDLSGLRIGVLGDIRLNPKFDQDGQLHKIELRDYETMVEMLLAGRLDAVAGNSISLYYLLQKRKQPAQQWPQLLLQKTEVWAQFSRRSPRASDAEKLTETIDRLRQKGFFETLLTRYAGDSARY